MKKLALILILILIPVLVLSGCRKKTVEQPETKQKKKVSKPVNVINFEERPYVVMSPTSGREVDVTVYSLPKAAESAEYLAEYQYGTSLGGNEQFIELAKLPATKQFALYSRSAGGKTSYEEDVQGGTLRLDFNGAEAYSVQQPWKYIDNKTKGTEFAMKDGSFSVEGSDLKNVRYAILYNSPGTPMALPGTRLSEVFTFTGVPSLPKSFSVSIIMTSSGNGQIYGYDGKSWQPFPTKIDGQTATATVTPMQAYVVAGK